MTALAHCDQALTDARDVEQQRTTRGGRDIGHMVDRVAVNRAARRGVGIFGLSGQIAAARQHKTC